MLPHYAVQKPRIWLYGLLSTAKHVEGSPIVQQPVLLLGQGRIIFGKGVHIGVRPSPFLYNGYIHIEARNHDSVIYIGDHCWINNNCVLISEGGDKGGIEIGAETIMGTNVEIYDSDFHELDPRKRMTGVPKTARVSIGRNVFLGSNVRVLKGVRIGDNSVVGNGSVVVKDIPANVIAAGNPAMVARKLED